MNGSKSLGTIVAVIAVMIVVSAVAIPVFSSMSDSVYATEENDVTYYRMSLGDSSTYLKIEVTDTEGVFLVNGETVDTSDRAVNDILMVVSDAVTLRLTTELQIYGAGGEMQSGYYALSTEGSYIEFSEGTVTSHVASTDVDYAVGSYTMVFYPDDDGDWMMNRWQYAWVDDGATAYVGNYANVGDARQFSLLAVTDGTTEVITSKVWDSDSASWTDRTDVEVVVNVADTGDYASYIMPSTYELDGETLSANNTWISPYTYKVVTDEQRTLLSIVDVIPLLIVVMVLIVAAYGIIRARED